MNKLSKSHFLLRHSQGICQVEFEDTKGVIRIRKSVKGLTTQWSNETRTKGQTTQWPKETRTNNDLQNIHIKRVTRTPLKAGINSGASKYSKGLLYCIV
jgi:hypothetical protein